MAGEHDIVELDRRRQAMVARRILVSDLRGVEEHGVGDEVGREAEDVDGREVDGRAAGAAATQVEQRLRVEGEGPGESVDPAEDIGEGGEEGEGHYRII